MPHQRRAQPVYSDRAGWIEYLGTRVQTLFDDLLDTRRRKFGAHHNRLGVVLAYGP